MPTLFQRFYHYGDTGYATEVQPTSLAVTGAFPTTWLSVPGVYEYNGFAYDMRPEGLYRLMAYSKDMYPQYNPYIDAGFRLSYAGTGNTRALLSGIAGVCVHGIEHEGMSYANKLNRVRSQQLSMRCGYVDIFARTIMDQVGIPCRSVSAVTLEGSNGFDDGHIMTEARTNGAWVLYDLSFNRCFRNLSGTLLSAGQVPAAVASGACVDDVILRQSVAAYTSGSIWEHLASAICETNGGLATWTRRIIQAIGIWENNLCYFKLPPGATAAQKSWLLSLSSSWRVIDDPSEWQARFYGAGA